MSTKSPEGLKFYLNVNSTLPTEQEEHKLFQELVELGHTKTERHVGRTYNYYAYKLTEKGLEARDLYQQEEANRLINNVLDDEQLGEILDFNSESSERHTINMTKDECELLGTLHDEYELLEEHWEESWDDAWTYFELSKFGKILWHKLKKEQNQQ